MAAKSKTRSSVARRKTRTSIVGMTIYPASVEPSLRVKGILEALTGSTAKAEPKRRVLKEVVADLPEARRTGIEKRTKVLVAEGLSLSRSRGPRRR